MGEMRVVLRTDQFEQGCRFYGEVLGWPVIKQWDGPSRGRIFGRGESARVELLEVAAVDVVPATGVMLAVEVDDLAGTHGALVAAGVTITQPLADQPWGHRNFAVEDPTGLPIVLFEVLER
ncbi:MAG: VOC family protein [Ilumatobacteraceae bacterium]